MVKSMSNSNDKKIRLTLIKSPFGKLQVHRQCVNGLGLRRMHKSVVISATPENMGMVRKAAFMLKIEEL